MSGYTKVASNALEVPVSDVEYSKTQFDATQTFNIDGARLTSLGARITVTDVGDEQAVNLRIKATIPELDIAKTFFDDEPKRISPADVGDDEEISVTTDLDVALPDVTVETFTPTVTVEAKREW